MTQENLLTTRFKVIYDYPNSIFTIDQIVELNSTRLGMPCYEYATYEGVEWEEESFFTEYPHLFKKLEWWEERNEEDLPKYLKEVDTGRIDKVTRYFIDRRLPCFYNGEIENKGKWKGSETPFNLRAMIPATEAEYLSSKNPKS